MFRSKQKDNADKPGKLEKQKKVVFGKPTFPAFAPSRVEVANNLEQQQQSTTNLLEPANLYVTNLPNKTNMDEMNKIFPECVAISLGVNNASEPHAAFVGFPSAESAARACVNARGSILRGNTLIVSPKIKFN